MSWELFDHRQQHELLRPLILAESLSMTPPSCFDMPGPQQVLEGRHLAFCCGFTHTCISKRCWVHPMHSCALTFHCTLSFWAWSLLSVAMLGHSLVTCSSYCWWTGGPQDHSACLCLYVPESSSTWPGAGTTAQRLWRCPPFLDGAELCRLVSLSAVFKCSSYSVSSPTSDTEVLLGFVTY